jgi:hypothetical protein
MLDQPNQIKTEGGGDPIFHPLSPVTCISVAKPGPRKKNMRYAMSKKLGLPRITEIPLPMKEHLAIVAGGPSLNDTYKDVAKFDDVMTCGSVHDYAITLGIKAKWHLECDPYLPQIKCYKTHSDANYLIASRCSPNLFHKLRDRKVYLWHMWEQELGKKPYKGEMAFVCGATVTLAAIPIGMSLGYKHLHFFGFDSSFETFDKNHAYEMVEFCEPIQVRVGDPITGKTFNTTATWAGQAQQFEQMRNHWPFKATIYGNGLIAEMERIRTQGFLDRIKAETNGAIA